jgi:hypothetical protein
MTQRNEKTKNEKKSSLLYMAVLGAVALALLTTMVPSSSLANALTQYAGNGGNAGSGGSGGFGGDATGTSGAGGPGGSSSEGGSGGSSGDGGAGGAGGIGEEVLEAALELVGADEYVGENSANGGNGGDSTGGAGGDSTAGAGGNGGSTSETNGGNADGGAGGNGGKGGDAIAICNAFACNDDGIPAIRTPTDTV